MKKSPKIEYGIEIVKPWSKEMYDHNDKVAIIVRTAIHDKWVKAYNSAEDRFKEDLEEDQVDLLFSESEWSGNANVAMMDIQEAVTVAIYMSGEIDYIEKDIFNELQNAAYWRLKEIAEELDIKLDKGFIGLK